MLKKTIKITLRLIGLLILLCALYLLIMTVTSYKPSKNEILSIKNNNNKQEVKIGQSFSLLTFDLSYCRMDKEENHNIEENLKGITNFITSQKPDFILLQEVDKKSSRSGYKDEQKYLSDALKEYASSFAYNYKSLWVPFPVNNPLGHVESGISTFSKDVINVASRYEYTAREKWPGYLMKPDICFTETRIPADNGKELILVNSYLSVNDNDDSTRKQELTALSNYIKNEYKKGNYVIVGGNWNCYLPSTDPDLFKTLEANPDWLKKMPDDFRPSGFSWTVDKTIPTMRTDENPYKKNINFTAVTDGFLVSDNIEVKSVSNCDEGFEYSDHNPVKAVVILKK